MAATAYVAPQVIEDELTDLRGRVESEVPDSQLVTCVRNFVRVQLSKSYHMRVTICLTFPPEYPTEQSILVEMKSATLSDGLLNKLVKLAEEEAKTKHVGRPHCLLILKFISQFFTANPLCICWEEIATCRRLVAEEKRDKGSAKSNMRTVPQHDSQHDASSRERLNDNNIVFAEGKQKQICDEVMKSSKSGDALSSQTQASIKAPISDATSYLKLTQRTSTIMLYVTWHKYFFKCRLHVPTDYPRQQVEIDKASVESNFSRVIRVWLTEQSREIARRCVQPPKMISKTAPSPFRVKASLVSVVEFITTYARRYADEVCQCCMQRCFPPDPADVVHNENAAAHVERIYCSHLYHHDCLILYMKTPPFTGGKKCHSCSQRIFHETWKVTPELAEARWAHQQAKDRELAEVVDFLADMKSGDAYD